MNYVHATDEFLTYLAVKRNYSEHTVAAYADDLIPHHKQPLACVG